MRRVLMRLKLRHWLVLVSIAAFAFSMVRRATSEFWNPSEPARLSQVFG